MPGGCATSDLTPLHVHFGRSKTQAQSEGMRAAVVFLVMGMLAFGTAESATGVPDLSRSASKTGNPRFHATLRADGHVVTAGSPWHFVGRSFDSANQPIPGTASVRVRHAGRIVDAVGWCGFTGVVRRTCRWPTTRCGPCALLAAGTAGPACAGAR